MTITGTGFGIDRPDVNLEVDIDGTACEIFKHTSTEILCWTKSLVTDDELEDDDYRYEGNT